MYNLSPSNRNAFAFHPEIVLNKRDADLVARLRALDEQISTQFDAHEQQSSTNTLEGINSLDLPQESKVELMSLYKSKNRLILELKNEIVTNHANRVSNTCQYCTINSIGPMDHIIPKAEFPEFSVHPKNLFPCCSQCNEYKSNTWLRSNQRQFLNLYLDVLPQIQYLFVEVQMDVEGVSQVNFFLSNQGEQVSESLFAVIQNHYDNLHLLNRFATESNSEITNLRNSLISLPKRLTIEEVMSSVIESAERDRQYYGYNYWKSILKIALVNNENFLNSCGFYA